MTTTNTNTLNDRARTLADEVSARWPALDHGDGALYTMASEALDDDASVTAERVAEIAREAESYAAAE